MINVFVALLKEQFLLSMEFKEQGIHVVFK